MKYGKSLKKGLSILLSICMAIGIFPTTAFAEGQEAAVTVNAAGTELITVVESEGNNKSDILTMKVLPQEIERDYEQELVVSVTNNSGIPVQYYLTCDNQNKDLYMNFVQSGSEEAPLIIQADETQDVKLSVFAQNAKGTEYTVGITAHINGMEETVFKNLLFRCKASDNKVALTKGTVSSATLATDYTLEYTGNNKITDISLSLSGEVSEYARISPAVENLEMGKGESVTVQVIPDLAKIKKEGKAQITGTIMASGGAKAESDVFFDVSGKNITSTTMGELALVQDKNPFADMEFDEDALSMATYVSGTEQNFADITKKYWDENDPSKDGVNTEEELKEVIDTLFDKDGMIDFKLSDTIKYDKDKSMDISVAIETKLVNPESVSGTRTAGEKDTVSGKMPKCRTYTEEGKNIIEFIQTYIISPEEYYNTRDGLKDVVHALNIKANWAKILGKPITKSKIEVTITEAFSTTVYDSADSFMRDLGIATFTKTSSKSSCFLSKIPNSPSYIESFENYINTVTDVTDVFNIWSNPKVYISNDERIAYTTCQVARTVNRYWGATIFTNGVTMVGTAIGDGVGTIVGMFAGNVLSGLCGLYLDKKIELMEQGDFTTSAGAAILFDIFGEQCTNAGVVKSNFYLPNCIANQKPDIHETGRMYTGRENGWEFIDKNSVGYDYYIVSAH